MARLIFGVDQRGPRVCPPGRRKLAVKVVDIFGNDAMAIVEVGV